VTENLFQARRQHDALVQSIRDAYPDVSEEDLADTIEGESTLEAAIIATLRAANEHDMTLEALKLHMDRMTERAALLKLRSEKLRAAALQAAQEADIKMPLKAPDFTASVALGKPKVMISGDVPDTFMRIKKEPNKTAIMDALSAGVKLPWASLSNATPHWVIRTK
jgi:Siphovirus Gp157